MIARAAVHEFEHGKLVGVRDKIIVEVIGKRAVKHDIAEESFKIGTAIDDAVFADAEKRLFIGKLKLVPDLGIIERLRVI